MVTTIHDISLACTGKEDKRTGHQIAKPTCILQYNKYRKGVGQSDQYLANFNILQKTHDSVTESKLALLTARQANELETRC